MQEDVDIRVRLQGAKKAEADAKGVASGLDHVKRSAVGAAGGLQYLRAAGSGIRGTMQDVASYGRQGAFALGAMATAATAYGVRGGLAFNATMEQNTIAFTNFLGSADAAKKKLDELYGLAKTTPFEFPELIAAQTRLMGFGMEADKATRLLRTVGDAISGVGGGSDEVARVTLALGQMQAKGKVSMEELNQLAEARIPALSILKEELNLSQKEVGKIGTEGIEAGKAIAALQRGLDKRFGGQAAKQAKTFTGQLSAMKDSMNQTLGAVTYEGFEVLRDEVFPALNDAAEGVAAEFQRTDRTFAEHMRASRRIVSRELGPLASEVEAEIRRADLGGKLSDFVEEATPKVIDAAAAAAPKAASAFVNAWLDAGPWGKLLTLGLVSKKLGVFGVLGNRAADRFTSSWTTALPGALDGQKGAVQPQLAGFGKWMGRAMGFAAVASLGLIVRDFALQVPALAQYSGREGFGELYKDTFGNGTNEWFQNTADRLREEARQKAGPSPAMRPNLTPTPQVGRLAPLAPLPPLTPTPQKRLRARGATAAERGEPTIHTTVTLDGRAIAEAVSRREEGRRNRR